MRMLINKWYFSSVVRITALCLIITLFFAGQVIAAEEQHTFGLNTWADLQAAIDQAAPDETIVLTSDFTALSSDYSLMIPAGKHLTIDLNGHTLDRNLDAWGEFGSVIQVNAGAALTVRDGGSSDGLITGGYHNNGGGILNRGTLVLEGGLIKGNTVLHNGGGISNNGTMILLGGCVRGNTALRDGGGVSNDPKGHMTICGDIVFENDAPKHADIFNQGTMTITGGDSVTVNDTPEDADILNQGTMTITGSESGYSRIEDMPVLRSYIEELATIPFLAILVILLYVIWIDKYLSRVRKMTMRMIVLFVFSLIFQNYMDYRLALLKGYQASRIPVSIYGFAIRPMILILFIRVLNPGRRYRILWTMAAANALVYLTAFFSKIAFSYTVNGHFVSGPLHHSCTALSTFLLGYLFVLTIQQFHPVWRKESWLLVFVTVLITCSVVMDFTVVFYEQPVSFLTMAIVISSVFYYIWLHLQFVREHEQDLLATQRIQIMMTQIQPHFLFNALNTIRALYTKDQALADKTLENFSAYLRQNLSSLSQSDLIPFSKELEHTRLYAEIEVLRFPNVHIEYRIADEDFLIPALTIQPLVENAIRHGVRSRKDGLVVVSTISEEHGHRITIEDNGVGFDPGQRESDEGIHIGMRNVKERVEKMTGGAMILESEPGKGTRVMLLIPDESGGQVP